MGRSLDIDYGFRLEGSELLSFLKSIFKSSYVKEMSDQAYDVFEDFPGEFVIHHYTGWRFDYYFITCARLSNSYYCWDIVKEDGLKEGDYEILIETMAKVFMHLKEHLLDKSKNETELKDILMKYLPNEQFTQVWNTVS